jgi:hypothetical protein
MNKEQTIQQQKDRKEYGEVISRLISRDYSKVEEAAITMLFEGQYDELTFNEKFGSSTKHVNSLLAGGAKVGEGGKMKVYKPHVTAQEMSIDGWSRGFQPSQTLEEMRSMGVDITEEQLTKHWKALQDAFEKPYNEDFLESNLTTEQPVVKVP